MKFPRLVIAGTHSGVGKTTVALAVVAAIHDLMLASRYCDRLLLLKAGSVIADDAPAAVLTPERLADAFGVVAQVAPDPLTGGLTITVLSPVAEKVGPDRSGHTAGLPHDGHVDKGV